MFYNKAKKEALGTHESAVNEYNKTYKSLENGCKDLYEKRKNSIELIREIEVLINSIANHPKEFEKNLLEIETHRKKFNDTESYAKEAYQSAVESGKSTAAGVAGGAAIASLAPTAAMWIATTFGTASTGVAISTLTGAAATNAALAWLGGGALAAGGAGMAGGHALLALAGPIGWGIAGVTTGISIFALSGKNKKIAEKAGIETQKIKKASNELKKTVEKLNSLKQKTSSLLIKIKMEFKKMHEFENANYSDLSDDDRLSLGAFVNNTLALAALLNETIE